MDTRASCRWILKYSCLPTQTPPFFRSLPSSTCLSGKVCLHRFARTVHLTAENAQSGTVLSRLLFPCSQTISQPKSHLPLFKKTSPRQPGVMNNPSNPQAAAGTNQTARVPLNERPGYRQMSQAEQYQRDDFIVLVERKLRQHLRHAPAGVDDQPVEGVTDAGDSKPSAADSTAKPPAKRRVIQPLFVFEMEREP